MSQNSFRKVIFAWMAGRQTQPDHFLSPAKRVMSFSFMFIVLLSSLVFTQNNTKAHTIDANQDLNGTRLVSTGGHYQISNGVIGDRVWYDANGNGLQDAGEPGVAGVTVTLYNAADDTAVASTITDGDGSYSFTGLDPGDYYVGFTLPADRIFTTYNVDGAGIDGPLNSDVVTATLTEGITEVFNLGAAETNENVDAGLLPGCDYLDWDALGYVTGVSSLQTFTNIQGRDLDLTIEVRMYNAAFTDIGPYQAEDSTSYPTTVNGDDPAFSVRNITTTQTVGMIVSKFVFSEPISINGLWLEPFYFRTDVGVSKHMAIQAFDADGNGILPGSFTLYNGSTLVSEPHPTNGQPWLRSQFPTTQTNWSGAFDVNYGDQQIREIDWYSWGENSDGSFSREIGSSYFSAFYFCQFTPTAVSLIDVQSGNVPALPWAAGLVVMALMTGLLFTARRR